MEDWRGLFRERFVIEENTEEQYLRKHDHRTIVEELEHFIEEELSKAREEGIREALEEVLGEMGELEYSRSKGLRNIVDIEEVYRRVENRIIKLDKLKTNK